MSDLCAECFPPAADLAVLAARARDGEVAPCAGDGSPDTVIGCEHGSWRLGDVLPAPACRETTKAGNPCQGIPGPDGLCAAHKSKGDADAAGDIQAPVVGADQAEEVGGGQEGGVDAAEERG